MKDAIELTQEALDLFRKFVSDGRDLEEIHVVGATLASIALTKQIYDEKRRVPEQPRDFQ